MPIVHAICCRRPSTVSKKVENPSVRNCFVGHKACAWIHSHFSNLFVRFEYRRNVFSVIVSLVRTVSYEAVVQFNKFIVLDAEFLPEVWVPISNKSVHI